MRPRGAVHPKQLLRLRSVGLGIRIAYWPPRRDPRPLARLAEIALSEPIERGAVELRSAADERERFVLLEEIVEVLTDGLATQDRICPKIVAALDREDVTTARGEAMGKATAAKSATDDDNVEPPIIRQSPPPVSVHKGPARQQTRSTVRAKSARLKNSKAPFSFRYFACIRRRHCICSRCREGSPNGSIWPKATPISGLDSNARLTAE